MITQQELVRLANKWPIKWKPEYRRPICIGCGRNVAVMWHIWLDEGGYKKEVHLCKKCGKGYDL
jgi:RNase P subunit RPR2